MVLAGVALTGICTPAYLALKGIAHIERGVTNAGKARCDTNLRRPLRHDRTRLAAAVTLERV